MILFNIFLCAHAAAEMLFDANNVDSIAHFRAFKPDVDDRQKSPLVRHVVEDAEGYIWMAGDPLLVRYDGYKLNSYLREGFGRISKCGIPYVFRSQSGILWTGDCGLHAFDPIKNTFTAYNIIKEGEVITDIIDYRENQLIITGDDFGFLVFDTKEKKRIKGSEFNKIIGKNITVTSLLLDEDNNQLWILSPNELFRYDIATNKADLIYDFSGYGYARYDQRDLSLLNGYLWIATLHGLIRIDIKTGSRFTYGKGENKKGLSTHNTTTTFVDSNNNLWVGTEKEGLCVYQSKKDTFLCLPAQIEKEFTLPMSTIEDINEDSEGSLWISANKYGVFRITPDIEKIQTLKNTFSNTIKNYFPHTFDAIVRDNGDVWLATDGGGINIFNYKDYSIRNIKHDPSNKNSLPTNSVISLTEDENGFIWAGFWAGGISKINPETMEFKNYKPGCNKNENCLNGISIFVVEADSRGGIWSSIWGYGLQYLNIATDAFTPPIDDDSSIYRSENKNVVGLVERGDKAWFVGSIGLEYYDYNTGEFHVELEGENYSLTSIIIDGNDFYLGSRIGLYIYNIQTKEIKLFQKKDGLVDNVIFYMKKDQYGKIWIATSNGISIYDNKKDSFSSILKKDGLVSNDLSTYGEFFEINEHMYSTSKKGVNIINAKDLPKPLKTPTTILSSVKPIINQDDQIHLSSTELKYDINPEIPHKYNNLQFEFTALSFVFPEKNIFKYRLLGWKDSFIEVDSYKRIARFTNLQPGDYIFELYSANSAGTWDTDGIKYQFTILPPWYQNWWAIVIFVIIGIIFIYLIVQFNIARKIQKEKLISTQIENELSAKVDDKTSQLREQALELKKTSDSLSLLNSELESRVDKRTAELKIEISERRVAESKLFHMAFHDSLTGLPNREWLIQKVNKTISLSLKNKNIRYCLMFLDGDRFKQINDTHGHIVGDQLLISAAKRLTSILGGNQYVTRLGGDEFTVFSEIIESEDEMISLAKAIIDVFSQPFCIENNNIHFQVSIGIVICDYQYKVVTSILRDADIAMYKAKEQGKGTYKLFDTEMRTITLSLAELESDLHDAVLNDQFYLMYQPLINIKNNQIIGFEALIRWEHPENGNIPPLDFIPLAEETGLIWDVGAWVLDESLKQMSSWHKMQGSIKPTIAVNISSGQLRNSLFLSLLDEKIQKYNIDPRYLKLELTESVLMENNETVSVLINELNKRNIDLAIDDFGTGYSSLAYLNEIPVQQIKIDKRFIDAIDATASGDINHDALAIVKATISLGKSLRKQVTAEGIESQRQLDALRDFGCDFAQGYFIAKPLIVDDAEKILIVNQNFTSDLTNRVIDRDNLLDKYKAALSSRSNRLRDKEIL